MYYTTYYKIQTAEIRQQNAHFECPESDNPTQGTHVKAAVFNMLKKSKNRILKVKTDE